MWTISWWYLVLTLKNQTLHNLSMIKKNTLLKCMPYVCCLYLKLKSSLTFVWQILVEVGHLYFEL